MRFLPRLTFSNVLAFVLCLIGLLSPSQARAGTASTTVGLYPADTWDYSWSTADGDPTSLGWAQGGAQTCTVASTTYLSVPAYSLTPVASAGTAYIYKASGVVATGSWELRLLIAMPASTTGSTAKHIGVSYMPDTTAAASKRFEYAITSTAFAYESNSALTSAETIPDLVAQWMTLTIRARKTSTAGVTNYWVEVWIGTALIWGGVHPTLAGIVGSAGDIVLGKLSAGSHADVTYIASVKLKNGINSAPPWWSLRSSTDTWPR